jgi:DNA-binding transcriptional regulator GbsR (MarR family)
MADINLDKMGPIVRYFNKMVDSLGLSRNSGSILALLYIEKYKTGETLNLDEIAEATSYSRSNVTLILSQLEAMGIVYGETDLSQTGRGRRRILYRLAEGVPSPISLMLKQMTDKLADNLDEIESLKESFGSEMPALMKMFLDFEEEVKEAIKSLSKATTKTVKM